MVGRHLLARGDRVAIADRGLYRRHGGQVLRYLPQRIDMVEVLMADGTVAVVPDWVPTRVRQGGGPSRPGRWRIRRIAVRPPADDASPYWVWVATAPGLRNGRPVVQTFDTFDELLGYVEYAMAMGYDWAQPFAKRLSGSR